MEPGLHFGLFPIQNIQLPTWVREKVPVLTLGQTECEWVFFRDKAEVVMVMLAFHSDVEQ